MAGQAAALRKTGWRSKWLYLVGGAIATLNILWFGRWMISNSAGFPDALIFWSSVALFAGLAGYFLTRRVYGYLPAWGILRPENFALLGLVGGVSYVGRALYLISEERELGSSIEPPSEETRAYIALVVLGISIAVSGYLFLKKEVSAGDAVWGVIGGTFFGMMVLAVLFLVWGELAQFEGVLLYSGLAILVPTILFVAPVTVLMVKEYIKEWPFYREDISGITDRGGASRFAGFYWYTKLDRENYSGGGHGARHFIGRTFNDSDPRLGGREIVLDTDNHLMTVAAIGAGKSYYSAWNVLPEWRGGAFVLDPKGEHAKVMGGARASKGRVVFFDPWGLGDDPSASFNPLEEIDVNHPNARDDLMMIVEACSIRADSEAGNSMHFRENAEALFMGIMAHVLTTRPKKYHNLPMIYDTFLMGDADHAVSNPQDFDDLINEMAENEAMGKAAMEAAQVMQRAGERGEKGGTITTLSRSLRWVNTPSIRPRLIKSTFSMKEMKQNKATVFCMIPMEHMERHARLSRVLITMGLLSCRNEAANKERTLFLLDEFAQLGTFKPVEKGLVTMRSWGVKLWMFFQDIGQLRDLYSNPTSFENNSDMQFFGIKDKATSEFVSEMCGKYRETWTEGPENAERHQEKERDLRSASGVREELRKKSGKQYVFAGDVPTPLRLKLVPFTKRYPKLPTYKDAPKKVDEEALAGQRALEEERIEAREKRLLGRFVPGISKESYDNNAAELREIDPGAKFPSFDELNRANRIQSLRDQLNKDAESSEEIIRQLNELGEHVTYRYSPKEDQRRTSPPSAETAAEIEQLLNRLGDKATREQTITRINDHGYTAYIRFAPDGLAVDARYEDGEGNTAAKGEKLDAFAGTVEKMMEEARQQLAEDPEHVAQMEQYNDQQIRTFWGEYVEGNDYIGFYERHGDSLTKEELVELRGYMAAQERAAAKKH